MYYLFDGHKAIPANLFAWASWIKTRNETGNWIVAKEVVGESEVSTVFLGLNHQYGSGPPLVFETLVFGGPQDGHQRRYPTWEEAEAGHAEIVATLKGELTP